MPLLADSDDVKRVMGITDDSQDVQIDAALEAASAWVARRLRRTFSAGPTTYTFYDVRDDGVIYLPEDGTVDSVTDQDGATLNFRPAGERRIRLTDGMVTLTNTVYPTPIHVYVSTVTVEMTGDDTVPAPVKEATALIAGALLPYVVPIGDDGIKGEMVSERIGDYQYKVADSTLIAGVVGDKWEVARKLLGPWLKRRVAVI